VIPKAPSVKVPVLSKTIALTLRASSKAVRLRISSPFRAPIFVETAVTSGMASPSAWGQEIMITVTACSTARLKSLLTSIQTIKVIVPAITAIKNSHLAARSANLSVLDFEAWASRTSLITWERKVSSPVRVTSNLRTPSPLIDPPTTSSPVLFSTGTDSPVSMDSFTEEEPSYTRPSMGTFSPGLTKTRSPALRFSTGTSVVEPSAAIKCAVSGINLTNSSRALDAPTTDFISIQCPRSMITISVANSQKKSSPSSQKTVAEL